MWIFKEFGMLLSEVNMEFTLYTEWQSNYSENNNNVTTISGAKKAKPYCHITKIQTED